MLDYIELNDKNHFLGQDYLYIVRKDDVYKYFIVECKDKYIEHRSYIHVFNIEFETHYLCFPDQQTRDMFVDLIKVKSVGYKTAKLILKTWTVQEFKELVKEFKYDELSNLKRLGSLSAKTIIESLQKYWFDVTYSTKEQKMIQAATRLGYSRNAVLKTIKKVDKKLKEDEYLKRLLSLLGNRSVANV